MSPPVLELRGVVRRYGTATVLDGIDLQVDEQQVVTLIGASGSGKSTLLRCVNLLDDIDDGQIFLDGTDISDPRLNPAVAQRRMAIVFQAFNLFPHMTALQNIALAPRVVHGLPYEAVAGRLGCTQNAARLRVSRALRALTTQMRSAQTLSATEGG